MRVLLVVLAILTGFSGCVRKNKVPTAQTAEIPAGVHEVKVEEVIQTSNYTYLRVNENGNENWIAVPLQEAAVGEVYYYDSAMEMSNFNSKELDRTFEKILFIQELSKNPDIHAGHSHGHSHETGIPTGDSPGPQSLKVDGISVQPAAGSVSIAKLHADMANYGGKKIKMQGKVVKANENILGKNWIHIQDGTGGAGDCDLTVTTLELPAVGDVVTFEGTITLKKDFGHGYYYEMIMEDAVMVK